MNNELNYQTTVIPAQPGFDLAIICSDNSSNRFEFIPIIAWAIELRTSNGGRYHSAVSTPICTEDAFNVDSRSEDTIIRSPDGCFHFHDGTIYEKGEEAKALFCAAEEWRKEAT